jgi:hypothetical protein
MNARRKWAQVGASAHMLLLLIIQSCSDALIDDLCSTEHPIVVCQQVQVVIGTMQKSYAAESLFSSELKTVETAAGRCFSPVVEPSGSAQWLRSVVELVELKGSPYHARRWLGVTGREWVLWACILGTYARWAIW